MSDITAGEEITRTVITIRRQTLQRLKRLAADRHMSMAALVRETLEQQVKKQQPWPKSAGAFDSGRTDLSELASDLQLDIPSWR